MLTWHSLLNTLYLIYLNDTSNNSFTKIYAFYQILKVSWKSLEALILLFNAWQNSPLNNKIDD
jgi:hypothetical protein